MWLHRKLQETVLPHTTIIIMIIMIRELPLRLLCIDTDIMSHMRVCVYESIIIIFWIHTSFGSNYKTVW